MTFFDKTRPIAFTKFPKRSFSFENVRALSENTHNVANDEFRLSCNNN